MPKFLIWTLLHLEYVVVIPARNFLEITPNREGSRSSIHCYSGDLDVPFFVRRCVETDCRAHPLSTGVSLFVRSAAGA